MNETNNQASNQVDEFAKYAGAGRESMDSGVQIPLIRILQKGSVEIDVTHEDHAMKKIEGAVVGDLLHPVCQVLKRPLRIVPVKFTTYYEERDGMEPQGFILGNYSLSLSSDRGYHKDGSIESITRYWTEDGKERTQTNRLMKTMVCGILLPDYNNEVGILKFQSSALSEGRKLQEAISRFRYSHNKDIQPPTFARSFMLNTKVEQNDKKQSWMAYHILPGDVLLPGKDGAIMDKALEFTKAVLVPELQAPSIEKPALVSHTETTEDSPF